MIPPQSDFPNRDTAVVTFGVITTPRGKPVIHGAKTHDHVRIKLPSNHKRWLTRIQFVYARPRVDHISLVVTIPIPPITRMTSQLRRLVPVLTLWRSSNFLDPVEKPVGGPSMFTLNHWALSPALCCRCEHLQSIHEVTQLPGTCHKSPLKCHLRRPCSSPRCFSSGLSLRNICFLTLPGGTSY